MLLVGIATAWADTSVITDGTDGWTKITSIPSNVGDYYFVFVDNTQDLMLSFGEGVNQSTNAAYKTMVYRTSEDPAMNPAMLWTLEANGDKWGIRNVADPTYLMQTEYDWTNNSNTPWYWRTHDVASGNEWSTVALAYTDGSWTIQNTHYTDNTYYIGPWNAAAFSNGQEVAGNKTASADIGHFQIYAILKTDVDWMANATESKPANLSYKVANSYAAYNGVTGWTSEGTGLNDDGRNDGNGFDGIPGFFEYWSGNSYSGTLSQNITGLPAGKYKVRAAGQLTPSNTTLSLSVNGTSVSFDANGTSNGSIAQSGAEVAAGSGVNGWQYKSVTTDITAGQTLTITFTSTTTAGGCWTNFDNVELYCLGVAGDPYEGWEDASMDNPLDWTTYIISGWECTNNDAWTGSGRTTAEGTYYDGTSRTYFTQNHEEGAARSQTVTIPKTGCYLLRTIVRPVYAGSYATITIGSESTTTRGIQTGSANIGNGWAYNDIYFATTTANESKKISIALSNVNSGREADCGEMHLYYIGQSADFAKDGVHKYIGTYTTAPALEVTDAVPVADVTSATFTSGSSAVTFTNPNGLVFVNADGQTSAAKNEVIGTTCANLQLEKGHPFVNPKEFTATNVKYTLADSELAGGSFATLMIPFTASTLAGTAYTLDQGVDLIDGNIRGTATTSIAANSPVLVTKAGKYAGSSVTVPVVASGATFTNGELVGTYTAMTAPTGSYVLQNHTSGEGVAFYLVGTTRPTVNPFRAYIKSQGSSARAIRVIFDDESQGIENVNLNANLGDCYDLQGRRVSVGAGPVPARKGLYIVNGRKVTVQ